MGGCGITKDNSDDFERCQKSAVMIVDKSYESYSKSLIKLDLENLQIRMDKLLFIMAKEFSVHEKQNIYFM